MVETRGGRRFAVFFLVAAFLVLFLGRWIRPVDNIASTFAAPFAAVVTGLTNGVGDTVSGVFDAGRLRQENAALVKQNGRLIRQMLVLQAETHDDALLRSMLKFQDDNSHMDLLPSRVIWQDPTGIGEYVMIDKGSRDGLQPGMTVLDQNGFFVGSISVAHTNNATILLMESPSSSVGALDIKSQASGLVEGRFAGAPQLDYVLTRGSLHVNDLVVTSGQRDLYPRNLLLGQITRVHRVPNEVFQSADIRPAADVRNLEIVQIVRNWNRAVPISYLPQH